MQSTGLLDKNGKEIYEGDIIDHKPIEKKWYHHRLYVELINSSPMLKHIFFKNDWEIMDHPQGRIWLSPNTKTDEEFEIIGNIYEQKLQ